MHDGSSTKLGFAIPGWRVIRSDAGRFWASRVEPFPEETDWYVPPFRTVDGDTFDALRAEVVVQEEAAERIAAASAASAASSETAETTALVRAAGRGPEQERTRAAGAAGEVAGCCGP